MSTSAQWLAASTRRSNWLKKARGSFGTVKFSHAASHDATFALGSGKKLDFCCFWPFARRSAGASAARARPGAPSRPSPRAPAHLRLRETAPGAPRSTRLTKSGPAASPRDALPRSAIGASSFADLLPSASRRSPEMSRVTAKSPRQSEQEKMHRADAAARLSRERGRRAGSSSRPRARWLRSRRICVGSRSRPRCPATGLRR